eukprot:scaffold14326_cov48-Attheya_sp.AAC.2
MSHELQAKRLMSPDFFGCSYKGNNLSQEEKKGYKTGFRREFEKFCSKRDGEGWADTSRTFFEEGAVDDYLVILRQQRAKSCYRKFVEGEDDDVRFDYEVDEAKFDEYTSSNNRNTRSLHSMVLIGVHQENGSNGEMGKRLQKTLAVVEGVYAETVDMPEECA